MSQSALTTAGAGPIQPLYKFTDRDEFALRHEAAVRAEYDLERKEVASFNEEELNFQAWIVKRGLWQTYTILADLRAMKKFLPQTGQSFFMTFAVGDPSTREWYRAERTAPMMNLGGAWDNCVELHVTISKSKSQNISTHLKPLTNLKVNLPGTILPDTTRAVPIQIRLRASKATMQAEIAALHTLIAGTASIEAQAAFSYLMTFENPTHYVDIFTKFPQLDPSNLSSPTLRKILTSAVDRLDKDQKAAFYGLRSIANGLCFVPGGPGAGKTTWTLSIAVLTQIVDQPPKILLMIDLNKSADDISNRVQSQYHKLGLDRTVIRMRGWPTVRFLKSKRTSTPILDFTKTGMDGVKKWALDRADKKSDDIQNLVIDCEDDDEEAQPSRNTSEIQDDEAFKSMETANFTVGFFAEMESSIERDPLTAPTLDRAAWEMYSTHKGWFGNVELAIEKARDETLTNTQHRDAMEALRVALISVYHAVLTTTDFIVTTPVAAKRHLPDVFKPQIVILDEAGHARELSAMISLAFFQPKAWFFTGDHRQTDPYLAAPGTDDFSCQLKVSTMERAAVNGAIPHQLLLNHRARGNLERLASRMFYKGAMRSSREDTGEYPNNRYPQSTMHLLNWLRDLSGDVWLTVPRAIVHNTNLTASVKSGTSYWNPAHHDYVMQQVQHLLQDTLFLQPPSEKTGEQVRPGTIMIISPYKEAVNRYRAAVEEMITNRKERDRVIVLTVDTAQGQEADVVFLDMVRLISTEHLENPKRLNVATTRARQAELIIMSERMVKGQGQHASKGNLRTLYKMCEKTCDRGLQEGVIVRVAI